MPTIINDWIQPFVPGQDLPHSLIWAVGYLWIGTETIPGKLIRMDPDNPGAYQTITFPNDGTHQWLMDIVYIPAKGKIYCLFGHPFDDSAKAITVVEVDPTTLAWTDVIHDLGGYNPEQGSMCFDENHIYIACRLSDVLLRFQLSDWLYNGVIPMDMGQGPHCCRYDFQTNRIFVTSTQTFGNTIAKVDPVTWTVEQYGAGLEGHLLFTDDLAIGPDYIYLGSELSGYVTRVSKFDLNDCTLIPIPHTGTRANYCVYYDNTWVWTSLQGSPGLLARINPLTLEVQTYDFPDSRQTSPNEIWHRFDLPGDRRLWFTFYTVPGLASQTNNMAGAPAGLAIAAPSVDGTVGVPLARAFTASGGDPPYTFIHVGVDTGPLPPGLTLASNGVYSGTPTTAGTYHFFVTVTDGIPGNSATAEVTATIVSPPPPPVVISAPSCDGTVGVSFSRQFTATGGVGPYAFSVTAGTLPLGLTLDASGLLSGVPGAFILFQPTVYHFTVRVTDSGSGSDSVAVTSIIAPASSVALVLLTPALGGRVGVSYSAQFTADSGTQPYSFAITAGTAPDGLTFVNGLLSGVPTLAGTFSFTVTVTDAVSASDSRAVTAIIEAASTAPPPTLAMAPPTSLAGRVGVVFRATFGATGGAPPYSFSVTGGSLPPGLALMPDGVLDGVPSTAGTFNFTVTVTDIDFATASGSFQSLIQPAGGAGGGGGTGGLPPGLTIDNTGKVTGVPTEPGKYVFTVRGCDNASPPNCIDLECSITVFAIDCDNPPGASLGAQYVHKIKVNGLEPGEYVVSATGLPPGLTMDQHGTISGVPRQLGSFFFPVTVCDFGSPPSCLSVVCFINVILIVPVPMESFWVMDIADRFNDPIVSSIPLLPGAWPGGNILASVDYLGIGSAMVVNQNGGVTDRPDPSDLGTGFCLLWDSNDSFGQSTPFLVPVTNQPNHRIFVTLPINGGSVPLNLRLYYNACGGGG
jgi:hypothetical protein